MSDPSDPMGMGRALNPFGATETRVAPLGGLISVEQQRAVAEVQARMIIARANPRDPQRSMEMAINECTRQSLAEVAIYQYSRGGTSISGPSIRLAEAVARCWGNIASGIKEVSRGEGYSECVAYAWDLQSGYYDERQFQIKHWRDTKKGGYPIADERDIYELIANMGQRRKRAVLLSVMPGDVIEAAIEQCEITLKATADTSPPALKKIEGAFASYGVTKKQLEAFCQCKFEAVRPAQIVRLRKIFTSLKDGMSTPEDWFEVAPAAPVSRTEPLAARAKRDTPASNGFDVNPEPAEATPKGNWTERSASQSDDGSAPQDDKSPPPVDVELYALDEFGEPSEEGPFHRPDHFAEWFAGRMLTTDAPDALREHNMDTIAEASADEAARAVIEAALATRRPANALLIELPTTPKGAPHWPNYIAACEAALAALGDATQVDAWVAANAKTYNGKAASIRVERAVADARRRIEGDAAPVEAEKPTAPAEPETTAQLVNRLVREVSALTSQKEITAWQEPWKAIITAMKVSDPALAQKVIGAAESRWADLEP